MFLADIFLGFQHILGDIKADNDGIVLVTSSQNWAATYDYDGLTRAVVMAHDRMIRVEFLPSPAGKMKLGLSKRSSRDGAMSLRHPTLEEAIATTRAIHPQPVLTLQEKLSRLREPVKFNDRIISEGFPDGWFIQDRICQNQALLCRKSDFSFTGSVCVCTRPRAMSTDDWILTAQIIAQGFEQENTARMEAERKAREEDDKPTDWDAET